MQDTHILATTSRSATLIKVSIHLGEHEQNCFRSFSRAIDVTLADGVAGCVDILGRMESSDIAPSGSADIEIRRRGGKPLKYLCSAA